MIEPSAERSDWRDRAERDVVWVEEFELRRRMQPEDVTPDGIAMVLDPLAQEVGVGVGVHTGVIVRSSKSGQRTAGDLKAQRLFSNYCDTCTKDHSVDQKVCDSLRPLVVLVGLNRVEDTVGSQMLEICK